MPNSSSTPPNQTPKHHQLQSAELNKSPLQLRCRELLKEAKADADPTSPYLCQLLQWGIDRVGGLERRRADQLISMTEKLLYCRNPTRALEVFLSPTNPEELQDQADGILDELNGLSPAEAWEALIGQLDSAMSAQVEGYPPGSE